MIFTSQIPLLILNIVVGAQRLGCLPNLCAGSSSNNEIANQDACNKENVHCGKYGGLRSDSRLVKGVDIQCNKDELVYAPIDGNMSFYRPRGGQSSSSCLDSGLQIQGTGDYKDYVALIAYVKPRRFQGEIKAGEAIGISMDLACAPNSIEENHILVQLFYKDKVIDPTYHLNDCRCTGTICESNKDNQLDGEPFKYKTGFGKGFELKCPMSQSELGEDEVPLIRSPIDAYYLMWFRPKNASTDNVYACDNEAIVLHGSGRWNEFTVTIYNAHFLEEPGIRHIERGDPIARRLNCSDKYNDFIFIEFRHHGHLVNLANLISHQDCKLPNLPD